MNPERDVKRIVRYLLIIGRPEHKWKIGINTLTHNRVGSALMYAEELRLVEKIDGKYAATGLARKLFRT